MNLFIASCLRHLSVSVGISVLIVSGGNFARVENINLTMLVLIPVGVLLVHLGYQKP